MQLSWSGPHQNRYLVPVSTDTLNHHESVRLVDEVDVLQGCLVCVQMLSELLVSLFGFKRIKTNKCDVKDIKGKGRPSAGGGPTGSSETPVSFYLFVLICCYFGKAFISHSLYVVSILLHVDSRT